jgi:hypothetical protein
MSRQANPVLNKSLKEFSNSIKFFGFLGFALVLLAVVIVLTNLVSGTTQVTAMVFPFLLAYIGQGLFGLAIAGALLRHAAKAIVDGLGGTVEIQNQNSSNSSNSLGLTLDDLQLDESDLARKITELQHQAWTEKGQPPLKDFIRSGEWSFLEWLQKQK